MDTPGPFTLPRLDDDLVWFAVAPGHLIAIDADSGDVKRELKFGSTQTITDYAFTDNLL